MRPVSNLFVTVLSATLGGIAPLHADDAADYGFLPTADAGQNVAALQEALNGGKKTVTVSRPGTYLLDGPVYIDDDTELRFAEGVVLKKTGDYTYVLLNRGALTRTWNRNITIDGLHISVNGVDRCVGENHPTYGMRGHLSLFGVRNARITRFRCLDVARAQFCVQFCRFENLVFDGFEIRGDKDGIHVGMGRNFVIRDGICATFDDGVALNAQDYPSSQPMQGNIEDGLIENVTDATKEKTSGNFSRLLTGAWVDWHKGIRLQNGDTVRHGRNVYRVVMKHGTEEYASNEAPVHTKGVWSDSSGLRFVYNQDDGALEASIRNVTFSNIYLHDRRTGFAAWWESGSYHRAVHPETPTTGLPECNVKLLNIHGSVPTPLISCSSNMRAWIDKAEVSGPLFVGRGDRVDCSLVVTGARIAADDGGGHGPDIRLSGNGALDLVLESMMQERDIRLSVDPTTRTRVNGTASINTLANLTPRSGDTIKLNNVPRTFDGTEWK